MVAARHTLAEFNAAPVEEAEAALLTCCSSGHWARQVADGRPYHSLAALYGAADVALADLDDVELDAALAGHPRIGQRDGEGHSASSRREQAKVAHASDATLDALAVGNREYEQKFGHVYLVCAEGRTGEELLAVLRARLGNDAATERANARAELGKINRIRLRRLIGAAE